LAKYLQQKRPNLLLKRKQQ